MAGDEQVVAYANTTKPMTSDDVLRMQKWPTPSGALIGRITSSPFPLPISNHPRYEEEEEFEPCKRTAMSPNKCVPGCLSRGCRY